MNNRNQLNSDSLLSTQSGTPDSSQQTIINMSLNERYLLLLSGLLLIIVGVSKRSTALFAIPAGAILAIKGATGSSPLYSRMGVNHAVRTDGEAVSVPHEQGVHISQGVTIQRDAAEIYALLKNPTTIERIIPMIDQVTVDGLDRGRWTIKLPGGIEVNSELELVNEVHGEVIGWRSVGNTPIAHACAIRFSPAAKGGTRVRLEAEYVPPAGMVGVGVATLLGIEPSKLVKEALRNLKQLAETGEIVQEAGTNGVKKTTKRAANASNTSE